MFDGIPKVDGRRQKAHACTTESHFNTSRVDKTTHSLSLDFMLRPRFFEKSSVKRAYKV